MRGVAALIVVLMLIPLGASANDCPSVTGSAIYDFSNGAGVANLHYGGERVFVEIEPVSFDTSELPLIIRVTRWHLPDGTVDLEETYEIEANGAALTFDSTVTVDAGGTGDLTWQVQSIVRLGQELGLNAIHQIEGSICVDSGS